MTFFNYDFDLVSIIIYLVVFVSYWQKKHINKRQHRIFLWMFFASLFTPIFDIPASILIAKHGSWGITVAANTLYYLAKNGTTFCFMLYVFSQIEAKLSISIFQKIFIYIPVIAVTIICLINPFTGWFFTYQDGIFLHGPIGVACYIITVLYYFWTMLFVFQMRNQFNKNFQQLIYIICIINILCEVHKMIFSSVMLNSIAFSISMLLMILNIERYGMVIDPVNGMAKREHLEYVIGQMINEKAPFQAMIIRMADYDLNTSNYGVETMEELIQEIEKYLTSYVEAGRAFKISNDCVVLLFRHQAGYRGIQEMIYEHLRKPFVINKMEVSSEYYITTLTFPELIKSKNMFVTYLQYFEKMQNIRYGIIPFNEIQVRDRVYEQQIEAAIENGLKNGNFSVFYQPICTANETEFITAEALLRLNDPELGYISPDIFIPIAEKNGSILKIGNFVLEKVCSFIEKNNMEQLGLEYIEMNLSTVQCLQHNFIDIIDQAMKDHKIDSKYICFEITETASNMAPAIFSENLKLLNERGFSLALDDFGTGYGNLQRMVNSDFKIIKFDKYMTQQLSSHKDLQKVYKSLQAMIETMGSKIVTEGVETKEQYEFVRDAGAHYIQGFYFSRPLPEKEFIKFLENKMKNL